MTILKTRFIQWPTLFVGDELVHVGRVRRDLDNDHALSLWIVADQLNERRSLQLC